MVYLSIEDGNNDIFLFINSHGRWLISGMAIFYTMQTEQYIHTSDPELDGWRVKNHMGKGFSSMSLTLYPQQVSEGKTPSTP
jgi:hypothetical protein